MHIIRLSLVVLFLVILAACGSPAPEPEQEPPAEPPMGQNDSMEMSAEPVAEFLDPGAEFSPLKYFDSGMVTLNDRCPVLKTPLNPKMEAVYVNGRPIGFC